MRLRLKQARHGLHVNGVPFGLAHLVAGDQQPAMRDNTARQWQASRNQKCRPVNRMEPDNVLADHVKVGRPPFPKPFVISPLLVVVSIRGKINARQIAGQGVVPDVKHLLGIIRPRHAPLDAFAADRDIAQTAPHETLHLITAEVRLDELRMLLVKLQEPVLKCG